MARMKIRILAIALTGVLGATAPAWAQRNNQQMNADLTALQGSVAKMEQDMTKLQRLLDNRAMLDLFQRVDELAREVSELRGLLEQQQHDLAGLKKRQRELYLDIDRRLRDLENTSTRAPATPPVIPAVPAVTPPAPEATAPGADVSDEPDAPSPPVIKPATSLAPGKTDVPVSEERAEYQEAFNMLKEGRYEAADAALRTFLSKYPQSSYAPNARYWLGESNYVTRKFEQALQEFQAVLTQHPNSNKVKDAMLKMGYTYYELRQFTQAKSILEQLQQLYPQSSAAKLGAKRLARMKREGY